MTGHVLAEHANQAKVHAIELLKRDYPAERHYGNHENVTVRPVEEVIYA